MLDRDPNKGTMHAYAQVRDVENFPKANTRGRRVLKKDRWTVLNPGNILNHRTRPDSQCFFPVIAFPEPCEPDSLSLGPSENPLNLTLGSVPAL